jgi:hypothetical protein
MLPWISFGQPECSITVAIASQDMAGSFDLERPFASQESPSNMLQPARSHFNKTCLVLELLPSMLPPGFCDTFIEASFSYDDFRPTE